MNKIPLDTLRYATLVVSDAKATARNYADFYGIERWNVTNATPERLQAMTIRGRVPTAPPPFDLNGPVPVPGQYGFISAIGSTSKHRDVSDRTPHQQSQHVPGSLPRLGGNS